MSLNGMQDLEHISLTISDTHLFPPVGKDTEKVFFQQQRKVTRPKIKPKNIGLARESNILTCIAEPLCFQKAHKLNNNNTKKNRKISVQLEKTILHIIIH